MRRKLFINLLFSLLIMVVGPTLVWSEATSTTTVEFSSAIHFLNPAGDDVEVAPGVYQVEAAEAWLKLVPEGESRSTAVLLETIRGSHEENVTEPMVRTISNPDTPDVLHVALLMPDGVGMEAVGTSTGIRPRGLNFAFVFQKNRTQTLASRPRTSAPRPGSQTQAPPSRPKGKSADCGPTQKVVGTVEGKRTPALAVFKKRLHLLAVHFRKPLLPSSRARSSSRDILHWIYENNSWGEPTTIPGQSTKKGVGLGVFAGRLHMVHLGRDSNDLWHSTYDGGQWTRNVNTGQKSKDTPALAVWNNQLHMVHLGDKWDTLWHSVNNGNGWTVNVQIAGKGSDKTPALGLVPNGPSSGRLHMVFKDYDRKDLWHTQYDGRRWQRAVKIPGPLTKAAPTVVSGYPDQLHLIHLGKSSDNLWHMLYGPNKRKNNRVEWFDERRLLTEESQTPVAVALFQSCYHMVAIKGEKLMHTTFSTPQIHPTVR